MNFAAYILEKDHDSHHGVRNYFGFALFAKLSVKEQ